MVTLPTTDKIENWTTLVSAVLEVIEDEGSETISYIPKAIGLAEERLTRELDTLGLNTVATVTVNPNGRFISKPTRYRIAFDVSYPSANGEQKYLTKVNDDFLDAYWPSRASVGKPKYYADKDDSNWAIAAPVSVTTAFEIKHLARPTPLSAAASTNYFTNKTPDALFYATMVHMAEFLKQWSQIEVWEKEYQVALSNINNEGRRARRDDGVDPRSPKISQNTLLRGN
jgi:hypothetical protein